MIKNRKNMSNLHLIDPGLWAEIRRPVTEGLPVLFLDRDGVIIEERHYIRRAADVCLTSGAADAISSMNESGVPVIIMTNQAGIGRGIYDWHDFIAVQDEMHKQLEKDGAYVDAVYACAYHSEGKSQLRVENHAWRKPNSGMLKMAELQLKLSLTCSWVVGDRASDLEAGKRAGLRGGTLVETGYGSKSFEIADINRLKSDEFNAHRAKTLADAIRDINDIGWLNR
jgi:D-glycero-D-manno-heptose 1,7-bisphosphate phosphatase